MASWCSWLRGQDKAAELLPAHVLRVKEVGFFFMGGLGRCPDGILDGALKDV